MNIIRVMRRKTDCIFVHDYKSIGHTLRFMRDHGCTELPVVNQEGVYQGAVSEGDILWYLLDYGGYEQLKDRAVGDIVRRGSAPALKITAADSELKRAALRAEFVPIVDDRGMFVGTVSREDVLQYFVNKACAAAIAKPVK